MEKLIKNILFTCTAFLCAYQASAQIDTGRPELRISKTDSTIHIDGILEEPIWNIADKAMDFKESFPQDKGSAKSQTEVQLTYDDRNLYIAAKCYNSNTEKKYVAQSLKRDFSFSPNDCFAVFIDAFGDNNNGLSFSLSPYGVQRDGAVLGGGRRGVTTAWDGFWKGEVHKGDGYWSLEIAIPFKTLHYDPNSSQWNINFARNDNNAGEAGEVSAWSKVPRGINVATLANTGKLIWDKPPGKPKKRITLVPYLATTISKDHTTVDAKAKVRPNGGIDGKFALSPSLNLDITFNPDFSQVEVDQQVINLDRFEVFFPERRLFFTENTDMFSLLGNSRVSPFFSRRIGGVGSDPVPIIGGIKLSGDINKKWRVGFLDMQTKQKDGVDDGQNYMVASVTRKFRKDSSDNVNNVTGFITNRQAFDGFSFKENDFNLTGGLGYAFRKGTTVNAETYIHFSTNEEKLDKFMAYGGKVRYETTPINIFAGIDVVGKNYITDMGYVPRLYHSDLDGNPIRIGYTQFRTNGNYWFFLPKGKKKNDKNKLVDFMGPYFGLDLFTNNDLSYQEHIGKIGWNITMNNRTSVLAEYINSNPILFYDFQLSGLDQAFSAGNYKQHNYRLAYSSAKKNILNGKLEVRYGDKFSGKQMIVKGEVNYRPKKWGAFGVNFSQNELFDFPTGYSKASLSLVGAKTEFSFSRNLFWTSFIQYNTQQSNFNLNTRFQWRYKPNSDIYLVFTNNQETDPFAPKNWSLAFKMNYWLNL